MPIAGLIRRAVKGSRLSSADHDANLGAIETAVDLKAAVTHASLHAEGGNDVIRPTITSPGQWVANQNNVNLSNATILRFTTDTIRNVTGFAGGVNGRVLVLVNVGAQSAVLKHQDTNSTDINRIIIPWLGDLTLAPLQHATLWYDGVDLRWRVVA